MNALLCLTNARLSQLYFCVVCGFRHWSRIAGSGKCLETTKVAPLTKKRSVGVPEKEFHVGLGFHPLASVTEIGTPVYI